MLHRLRHLLVVGGAVFVIAVISGCEQSASGPTALADPAFDVSNVACNEIDAARQRVEEAYNRLLGEIGDTYVEAIRDFQAEMWQCLDGIRDKGPCDDENAKLQAAYQEVSQDVSNDNLYNTYKAAKKERDECFANRDQLYDERAETNKRKEQECRDTFQMKHDAAERLYYEKRNTVKAQREAALAALAELERKCKEPKATGGGETVGQVTVGETEPVDTGGEEPGDEEVVPPDREIDTDADVCQGGTVTPGGPSVSIPGANSQVRTGKASPLGGVDVLKNLLQAVAEDVTGNPIPVSAISDQVFAVMVCAKIRTRLAELEIEQSDAQLSSDRPTEIRLRKKIADYNHASQVRCAIAEGRPPVALKDDMQQIQDAEFGDEGELQTCESASDCGKPACCSETELGTRACSDGKCVSSKTICPTGRQCGGDPASCMQPIEVIVYGEKYIPVSQVHKFKGDECDDAEHRHANAGSVKATDGTTIPDGDECGYGKVAEVAVKTIYVSK